MTKTKIITMITFGAGLLALGGQVSADEVVIGESPAVEVVETPEVTPVLGDTMPTDPVVELPVEEAPTDGEQTLGEVVEVPVETEGDGVLVEPNSPDVLENDLDVPNESESENNASEVEKQNDSQVMVDKNNSSQTTSIDPGMTSPSTGQVVSPISMESSIETISGKTIVGTRQGQLEVMDSFGNIILENPEEHGGKINNDGTVTVTKSDKSKVTLPNTGEESKLAVQLVGVALLLGLVVYSFKDKLKKFYKKLVKSSSGDLTK
ncbi:LPXTG cell wall anchor domain-containing protein [Streptococcus pluranimalium]